MVNNKVSAILQYAKGGQPQPIKHYIRYVEIAPDGTKKIIKETLLPPDSGINEDLEICGIPSGFPCASSEEEVLKREGLL